MTDSPTSAPSNTRSYNFVEDFYCDAGLWVSKILMTAVQSEVFIKLSGKAATLTQIQTILETEPSPNVVFELGWFDGKLGREKVYIPNKKGAFRHSNLEVISSIQFNESIREKINRN